MPFWSRGEIFDEDNGKERWRGLNGGKKRKREEGCHSSLVLDYRAYGHRFLETCNRGPRDSSWEFWGCNPLENSSTFDSATRYINIRHPIRHISNLEPYSNTLESSRNKSKNITNQSWKYPKYSTNLFHSDPKDIKITSQLRHKASSSKVTKSSNEKKRKERERKTKQMDRKRERENGGRRKVWRGTYRSRVVHQSRRVPGDRWTPGSMERPHNWENSAGLLVGRTHSHLSCRDRPGIDGSPRFELTPVKSCVARCHGKSDPSHRPIDTGYYFPLVTRTFYQLAGWKLESMWSWLVI